MFEGVACTRIEESFIEFHQKPRNTNPKPVIYNTYELDLLESRFSKKAVNLQLHPTK